MGSIFHLWGKYSEESFHPLILHSIDVRSVAESILGTFARDKKEADAFMLFLCAMHDIGKATPGFQAKVQAMARRLKEEGYDFPDFAESDHSKLGQYHLSVLLEKELGMDEELAAEYARIVTSHHGAVLDLDSEEPVDGSDKWDEVRREIFKTLYELYGRPAPPKKEPKTSDALFWMGLCSVSDWIASNEHYFPYESEIPSDLEEYRQRSIDRAKEALEKIGLTRAPLRERTFSEIFGFAAPNPVQKSAIELASSAAGPFLMLIEAPMGEGKTEAALAAYCELDKRYSQRGFYFALPTQATGNMIFTRIHRFLEQISADRTQLHLVHGNARFNDEYNDLMLQNLYGDSQEGVSASEWFVSRKRTLLAQYGVGTVDQSEMAALKVKHFFVRLFALSGKTLIIDEVHAYDAYMSRIIEMLLGWLAKMGTSVILLSATLPRHRKERLLRAFNDKAYLGALAGYPSISMVTIEEALSVSIEGLGRSKAILRPLPGDDWIKSTVELLRQKLDGGGCAACILNTVADAQKLYTELLRYFDEEELILFHARFTLADRLTIESRVVEAYGKDGKRPPRGIVVATQVIEQSLDVDFDLMITQPAPIDLMLQRMGRLHRHDRLRPDRLKERALYVLVPKKLEAKEEIFGASRFVYYPDILYKSIALIHDEEGWTQRAVHFPDDLALLVEQVYEEPLDEGSVQKWEEEREGEEYAYTFLADNVAIEKAADEVEILDEIVNVYEDDPDAPGAKTRLGRESLLLVMLSDDSDCDIKGFSDIRTLYERSVRVETPWVVRRFLSEVPTPEKWKKSPLLRYAKPFFPESMEGIRYDKKLGLVIERKESR